MYSSSQSSSQNHSTVGLSGYCDCYQFYLNIDYFIILSPVEMTASKFKKTLTMTGIQRKFQV